MWSMNSDVRVKRNEINKQVLLAQEAEESHFSVFYVSVLTVQLRGNLIMLLACRYTGLFTGFHVM